MSIKESITVEDVITLLNTALQQDPVWMKSLLNTRIPCNETLANHPTIQCRGTTPGQYATGFFGLLNGFFGVDENGYGILAMEIDRSTGNIQRFCKYSYPTKYLAPALAPKMSEGDEPAEAMKKMEDASLKKE